MKEIANALIKAQKEMLTPKKGSVNPFFKNKYADLNDVLEAIVPALNNNGIVLLQPLVNIEGKNFVRTVLMHESGETFESLAEIFCKNQNDAQAYGSGITYARRYSLSSICGIGSEDDDGNGAVKRPDYINQMNKCKTLIDLQNVFKSIKGATVEEIALKDKLKTTLK